MTTRLRGSNIDRRTVCTVVGGVGAGKSAYLAALWYAVQRPNSALVLERFVGDREFVNDLTHSWLEWKAPIRTSRGVHQTLAVVLRDAATGISFELSYPDLSGEDVEATWTERGWTTAFDASVESASGLLVFIHPVVRVPLQIGQTPSGWLHVVSTSTGSRHIPDSSIIHVQQTAKDEPPTAVLLTDLLTSIAVRRGNRRLRVSVIVSAWDLVRDVAAWNRIRTLQSGPTDHEETSPERWLRLFLPLFNQYLRSNSTLYDYRVFGVSAQGADLNSIDKERVASLTHDPLDRVIVEGRGVGNRDITAPLRWASATDPG